MSRRLLFLNGMGIIGVVLHHGIHWVLTGMFWWTDRYQPASPIPNFDQIGSVNYWVIRLIDQVFYMAVPIFLLVSGFFAAYAIGRGSTKTSWRIVFNRIKFLLYPYILWTIIILALRMVQGERFSPGQLASIFVWGKVTVPFYYVPLLIQLYLLSPFIIALAQRRWKLLLAIAIIVQLPVVSAYYYSFFQLDIPGIQKFIPMAKSAYLLNTGIWFVLGVIMKLHLSGFKRLLARINRFLLPSLILVGVIALLEWALVRQISGREWIAPSVTFFDRIFALLFILTYLSFQNKKLPYSRPISTLGSKTYGIYMAHMPVLDLSAKAVYHVAPGLLASPLLFWFVLTTIGLSIPLLLMAGVKRSPLHRIYIYVFG